MKEKPSSLCILFDWGDTLMRDFKEYSGPMKDWPRVESVPEAAEVLAGLHSTYLLCLATNADTSDETDIHLALQRVDLDRFLEKIYCFKTIGHRKPSSDFFAYILSDLGLTPGQVIMVGDSYETDVQGPVRCGLRAIWFNEQGDEDRTGDRIRTIHRLRELPSLVEEWN